MTDEEPVRQRTSEEREAVILEEIKKHPDIQHKELREKVVSKFMAQRTFDLTIQRLILEKRITFKKDGKQRKLYSLPDIADVDFELDIHEEVSERNQELDMLRKEFPKASLDEKKRLVERYMDRLLADILICVMRSALIAGPKKRYSDAELHFKTNLAAVFQMIRKDPASTILIEGIKEKTVIFEAKSVFEDW